jgi:hypothetical protein
MKTFKELKESLILLEILNTDEKKEVDTWTKGDNSFSDHMYKDHPHDAHFELESPDDSEHKPHIENHISKHGFKIKDYKKGIATDKHGRETSIGKALVKTKAPDELKNKFDNDPSRQQQKVGNSSDYHVVISRHPHHVAGMTSEGHKWQSSCMNFKGGAMNHYLKNDVKHGTHVAYLVHKDDHEIKNPLARVALKKFTNVDDENDHILRPENKTYGNAPDSFTHTVNKALERHFPGKHDGIYKKNENVYNDGGNTHIIGKDAIDRAIDHPDEKVVSSVVYHPNLQPHHINKILDSKNAQNWQKAEVLLHKNASSENLHKGLDHPEMGVRSMVLRNKNINHEHLQKALQDKSEFTRQAAISHDKATEEHISKALDDPKDTVRRMAILHKKATKEHIDKALDDPDWSVRLAALEHKNFTAEHHEKSMKDKNFNVRLSAIYSRHANEKHLKQAVKDIEPKIRQKAQEKLDRLKQNENV